MDCELDQALTLQHIYSVYYWYDPNTHLSLKQFFSEMRLKFKNSRLINIGSLAGVGTTLLEAHIGFGFAFLVPLILMILGFILFLSYSGSFGE